MFAVGTFSLGHVFGQTASTGAVDGVTLDSSGALLGGVVVELTGEGGGVSKSATSDANGRFVFLLITPGKYALHVSKADFEPLSFPEITISIAETTRLELHLRIATRIEDVSSSAPMVQLDSTLGRVVNQTAVTSLPLVTRNFTQLASLSPGISAGVYNAGELGLGGTAQSQIAASNDGVLFMALAPTTTTFSWME
jgi:hypothetical protein